MAPLHTTSTLHPYPLPSVPPLPTLPILLPPIALLAILLVLYIRRPATIVPTRPMAQIKTPLLARGRVRTHRRVSNYGGIRVPSSPSDEDEPEDGTGKGDGRPAHPRGDKRPKFIRRWWRRRRRNGMSGCRLGWCVYDGMMTVLTLFWLWRCVYVWVKLCLFWGCMLARWLYCFRGSFSVVSCWRFCVFFHSLYGRSEPDIKIYRSLIS
ncbi:hypothetical protein BJ508DRAFT_364710 [Ascobolus immersus RN42]|uniref:Transmembrane protein n=1 Tax=Ascobolus immersus RN42 TaxID=1160509 RepID=A0A3N4HVA0_ASCIM|nr:hypothetical protein BJ508DRAFT_364710 [Ascobolus immersus RN42]